VNLSGNFHQVRRTVDIVEYNGWKGITDGRMIDTADGVCGTTDKSMLDIPDGVCDTTDRGGWLIQYIG
jgi:hypothetical protein